jgi:hypothetical protein
MNVPVLTNGGSCILQKYRLHTRRPSPPPQTASAPAPQLVVLGSIWGSDPDYMAGSAAQTAVEVHDPSPRHPRQQYASYCKPSVQQDQFAHFNNGRSENKQQLQESVCVKSQQAVSQSQTSPQVELQSTWKVHESWIVNTEIRLLFPILVLGSSTGVMRMHFPLHRHHIPCGRGI